MVNKLSKFTLFFLMCIVLMGASNCTTQKYSAPVIEDCTTLTSWDNTKETDVATSFCIDDRINENYFEKVLVPRVESKFKEHPLHDSVMAYLVSNKAEIIKNKEYELPISYTRGYSQVSPADRTAVTSWAEANRIGRIKCELNKE